MQNQNLLDKKAIAHKSTMVSVVVNIVLGVLQVVVGFFANSSALIADGIHSFSDLLSDFVVLVANRHSHKDADEDHHYGHQRYETAASLFVGFSLVAVGLSILYKAGTKIVFLDDGLQVQILALWVAIFTLLSKEILFHYMIRLAKKVRSQMLVANAWHARSDAISSLLVAFSIIGGLFGYKIFDLIGAVLVGLMITKTGWGFSWNALHDLMDRSLSEEENLRIKNIIISTNRVLGCSQLKTRKMGDMILVDVYVKIDGKISVEEGYNISLDVKHNIMKEIPEVLNVMMHIEPFFST